MRSVFVHGTLSSTDLSSLLGAIGAEGQSSVEYAFGPVRIVLLVGRKFAFRSNDYLGVVVLAASNESSQRVDVGYAGSGSGILGAQWGAGESIETNLYDALVRLLQSRSLSYQEAGPVTG